MSTLQEIASCAWRIRRYAVRMGEVQGQGYVGQALGYADVHGDLLDTAWPTVDEAALVQDEIELVLQVNGKLRGSLTVSAKADKAAIEALAVDSDIVQRHTDGKPIKKVVVVPGRLINVVV